MGCCQYFFFVIMYYSVGSFLFLSESTLPTFNLKLLSYLLHNNYIPISAFILNLCRLPKWPTDFPAKLSTLIFRSNNAPFYMDWQYLLPITPDVADANRIFITPDPTIKPSELFVVQLNRCSVPG